MADVRAAWDDVSDRIEALALKLKLHTREELAGVETEDDAWKRLREAVAGLGEAIEDAVDDPAVRSDVRGVVDALGAALRATAVEVKRTVEASRSDS